MFYIHRSNCVSAQQTFSEINIEKVFEYTDNKLMAREPDYDSIPPGILRRMGRSIKLGIGTALPLIKDHKVDGIIIGTIGGMADCKDFLDQIIEYHEGTLTPTKFVQSSLNAVASQLSLLTANKGYNITHVNRGLSFENSVIDADMLINENPDKTYILGGVDEISVYSYNIDFMGGWFKKENTSNLNLYERDSPGTISGEGAAMFIVNGKKDGATCQLKAISIFNTDDEKKVGLESKNFLKVNYIDNEYPDVFLSGENGDNRFLKFFISCEKRLCENTTVARFKHMTGDFQTSSAIATWIATHILTTGKIPQHMLKYKTSNAPVKNILIYNNFRGIQHSLIAIEGS